MTDGWDFKSTTGRDVLQAVVQNAGFASLSHALAAHTIFAHPTTVAQTRNKAVFPIIRGPSAIRGNTFRSEGRVIGYDDNKTPRETLLIAIGLKRRPKDTQINHVYARSSDVNAYTALPNLCMTPTFLAKLTDTDPVCKAALQRRSFDLFGWRPDGEDEPEKPVGYDRLVWAAPASPIADLATAMRARVDGQDNYRTRMYKETGWLFGTRETE